LKINQLSNCLGMAAARSLNGYNKPVQNQAFILVPRNPPSAIAIYQDNFSTGPMTWIEPTSL
jgi:hypothetical protein